MKKWLNWSAFGVLLWLLLFGVYPLRSQTSHFITIAWSASPTSGVKYNVYRSTSATGTFATVGTDVAALTFDDSTGTGGTTYFYRVTAICDTTTTCPTGITGESSPSPISAGATFLAAPGAPPAAPTATAH